jgi:hypothetical protein
MKNIFAILILALCALACGPATSHEVGGEAGETGFSEAAQLLTADPCTGPVETGGSVGYQSHTRYISKIRPHATLPYALSITWAVNGVDQSTGPVDFGANSGAEMRAGSACTTALGEVFVGTGDCAGSNGWNSFGTTDRAYKISFAPTFDANNVPITRVFINDVKYLELWGLAIVSSTGPWTFGETGLTKWREDTTGVGSGPQRFWLDGYNDAGGLESHFTTWSNNSCIGR